MSRLFFLSVVFVVSACFLKAKPEGDMHGDLPVVVVNGTPFTITHVQIHDDKGSIGMNWFTNIAPKANERFSFQPGGYHVTLKTDKGEIVIQDFQLALGEATELVVSDQEPAQPVAAGLKRVRVATLQAQMSSALDACKSKSPNVDQPAPGKLRPNGSWKCVFAGAGISSTDFVTIAVLASGGISATVTGQDRGTTWKGALVKDELDFVVPEAPGMGGRLKIDAGGQAMTGDGSSYVNGQCVPWNLTCTKAN